MPHAPLRRPLRFERLESRRALAVTPIGNGEEVTREVGVEDPEDTFSFHANAGDRVIVTVGEQRARNGTVVLRVLGPDGSSRSDSDPDSALLNFQAQATGEYRAVVSEHLNDQEFDYKIRVVTLPGVIQHLYSHDAYLTRGEQHVGQLGVGEINLVQFNANAGSIVYATLGETIAGASSYPELRIVGPDGSEWIDGGYDAATERFIASATGLYTAVISDSNSDNALAYRFTVASLPGELDYSLPQNAYLGNGEQHVSSLGVGEQHFVQFHAQAGSVVYATLGETIAGASSYPELRIVGPDGSEWIDGGYDAATERFIASATGLYTAVISDSNSDNALAYRFRFITFPITLSDHALLDGALLQETSQEGAVHVGHFAMHPLFARVGSTIQVSASELAASPATVRVEVFSAQGTLLQGAQGATGAVVSLPITQTGHYYAIVLDVNNDQSFSYSISASGVSVAAAKELGDFNGDAIVDGSDFLAWQRNFSRPPGSGAQADANGDGLVNGADLAVWRHGFGAQLAIPVTAAASTFAAASEPVAVREQRPERPPASAAALTKPVEHAASVHSPRIPLRTRLAPLDEKLLPIRFDQRSFGIVAEEHQPRSAAVERERRRQGRSDEALLSLTTEEESLSSPLAPKSRLESIEQFWNESPHEQDLVDLELTRLTASAL